MSTKSMSRLIHSDVGISEDWYNGALVSSVPFSSISVDKAELVSTGHAWPPKSFEARSKFWRNRGYKPDHGGPFTLRRCSLDMNPTGIVTRTSSSPITFRRYTGGIYAHLRNWDFDDGSFISPSSNAALDVWGTKGVARALPTNPVAGMGQFLGELRQLPKIPDWRIIKDRAHSFRSLARRGSDEYLNQQFGWLPFIKDVITYVSEMHKADRTLADYQRGSGQHIRRRRTLVDTTVTNVVDLGTSYGSPTLPLPYYVSPGRKFRTETTTQKVWFSGAFTYYLPPMGKDWNSIYERGEALNNKLVGTRVTPELLWKLAPWSWAADWIGNTGDVLHNWSAFQNDGLVMHYGYVMEHKTVTHQWSITDIRFTDQIVNTSQKLTWESKTRRRATPYGFGLNPSSFSAKQWSIIGALGISKAPRSLIF